jgi:hypothetical protein
MRGGCLILQATSTMARIELMVKFGEPLVQEFGARGNARTTRPPPGQKRRHDLAFHGAHA